jgi:putative aldouronate transport system permease protein
MVGGMKLNNKISEGSQTVTICMYVLAAIIAIVTLYPMYYVLILSVSEPAVAATMKVYFFPKGFDLSSYQIIVKDPDLWRAYANTILYVVATTILMLITSVMVAYPLTVKSLFGRKYINMFLLITMYFSGGMIPSFLLITKLGLYDSPMSMIIPSCFSVWNIILVKSFLGNIPEALREAAKIDGANTYQTLFRVYLPMSKPILAVIAVYTIVSVWNSWFNALIYLPHEEWQPLQLYLRRILVDQTQNMTKMMSPDEAKIAAAKQLSNAQLQYAMIIFSSLPVLFTYPFFQRYFVKGITLGSLKE